MGLLGFCFARAGLGFIEVPHCVCVVQCYLVPCRLKAGLSFDCARLGVACDTCVRTNIRVHALRLFGLFVPNHAGGPWVVYVRVWLCILLHV